MRIFKFYKNGCVPCKTLARVLQGLEGYEIDNVDIELPENQELVSTYKIDRVPVLAITPEYKLEGVKSLYNIERWINGYTS